MITKKEYLIAKKVVEEYESQQNIKTEYEDFSFHDLDISVRLMNCLQSYDLNHLSEVLEYICEDPRVGILYGKKVYRKLMAIRNFGLTTHEELMKILQPYLPEQKNLR
jgi:DNA-directed RNA polymerase alpha subunit